MPRLSNWLRRGGGLRRWLRSRIPRATAVRRDSDKSRRELLDEIYYLRDVAGEREQRVIALQARVEALQGELTVRRPESARRASAARASALQVAPSAVPLDERRDSVPCLFVDVTELALKAGQTGIQRVVREVLRALLANPPEGYLVEAVYAAPGQTYRYARAFSRGLGIRAAVKGADVPICAQRGDVFLGLDHSMAATVERVATLDAMRRRGVRIWFVYSDSLPLSHPEWFPPAVHATFKNWLGAIARVADGVACISRAAENELKQRLDVLQPIRERPLRLGHFHLGADIPIKAAAETDIAPEQAETLERLRVTPSFLMVGTLEPRKRHAQALEAIELLWKHGENVVWVIAGLPGWMTEVVARRIRHHDEFGERLFWFSQASDALLERLYETCTVLLVPSEGEGFGLPLVEAARHGLPILCRDLPVFREVAGEHASYFSGLGAASLAQAMREWLAAHRRGAVPTTAKMPWLTWSESASQLLDVILEDCPGTPAASQLQGAEHA